MHCAFIGVAKKEMTLEVGKSHAMYPFSIAQHRKGVDGVLKEFTRQVPHEFTRAPRSLDKHMSHYKGIIQLIIVSHHFFFLYSNLLYVIIASHYLRIFVWFCAIICDYLRLSAILSVIIYDYLLCYLLLSMIICDYLWLSAEYLQFIQNTSANISNIPYMFHIQQMSGKTGFCTWQYLLCILFCQSTHFEPWSDYHKALSCSYNPKYHNKIWPKQSNSFRNMESGTTAYMEIPIWWWISTCFHITWQIVLLLEAPSGPFGVTLLRASWDTSKSSLMGQEGPKIASFLGLNWYKFYLY